MFEIEIIFRVQAMTNSELLNQEDKGGRESQRTTLIFAYLDRVLLGTFF